jgi:phosphoribosylanthranilate isomerase
MILPGIKICGITRREDARLCAAAGAGAVGAVFYEKSPRHVTPVQARDLFADLPTSTARVGVFVNSSARVMISAAREAGLDTVQMHGQEPLEVILAVRRAGFHVVKVLRRCDEKWLAEARVLPRQTGLLVECGEGALPGGNGLAWDWSASSPLAGVRSFAIAGGLNPANLAEAARASCASGFDVSSGLETAPGLKSEARVRAFILAASELPPPLLPFSWKGIS